MNRLQLASNALTAVLACLLAACSSDDDGGSSATSTSATSGTSTSATGGGSSVGPGTGGSTSSTGSGEGGDAGTDVGGSGGAGGAGCAFGDPDACPVGEYCDAPDCKTGACALLGAEDGDKAPVCGCDDVTYWNGKTAASHGMAIAASGECVTGTPCGGMPSVPCAAGQSCNIALDGPSACAANPTGVCWGMPTDCPIGIGFGANLSSCDGDPWCGEACGLIKSGEPWFTDDTCPL